MDMATALNEAARKARLSSPHNRIPGGSLPASEGSGMDELKQRREAARLGSTRLLDRIVAVHGRGVVQ